MFRKFLLACMVMATFTMQIQAISINELNSSSQFKNVYQKSYPYEGGSIQNKLISYLNTYSVESLEYAAPHYKLKGTFYAVYETPRSTSITEYELTATYNFSAILLFVTDLYFCTEYFFYLFFQIPVNDLYIRFFCFCGFFLFFAQLSGQPAGSV